ncbi:histidine phosphatase family protein [Gryllotalpicola reticulitermitis]|uniref:Histidine phosphatase family protein n=1 Tax=Gryllotalpicola reticulitermitis TaxID=1184153 RepID=A0ABV8Q4M8_9MICO
MSTQNLYLARHGQTALNAEGRLRGLANPPLDHVGVAEAERLAWALADKGAGIVLCSPLDRARRTGEIISQAAGIPLQIDERFNDRDYGPQTGQIKADVETQYGSVDEAPGVEPVHDIIERALPALDSVLDEDTTRDVIIVTHDALIRPLILCIDGRIRATAPTASWNHLRRESGHWSVVAIDQKPAAD